MSFFDYPGATPEQPTAATAFLPHATDEDWAVIREHAEVLHATPGQVVAHEGSVDRSLYIVLDGVLEATLGGRRGARRRVSTMEAGTVMGEIGFFDGQPRSAAVRAVTDTRLLRLGFDAFEALAAKDPALGRAILLDLGRVLAARIRAVEAL